MHPEEGGPTVEISFWMERRLWTCVRIAACSTPVPPGPWGDLSLPESFYLPMKDWQAIHFLLVGMVLAIHLFTLGQRKYQAASLLDWGDGGDFLCFICHVQENALGSWTETYTLAMYCVCHWSRIHQTWQPLEWQVIWHYRRCLCTRRQPCSVWGLICVTMHTCTHKKRSVCTGKNTVRNNSLWPNESDSVSLKDDKKYSSFMIFYLNIHILFLYRLTQLLYIVTYFIIGQGWH